VLWNIYLAYFHSRLKYGKKVLRIQRQVIRLITGINKYETCRQKFKENRILTVTAMYVLEVLCYIKKYNCEIHEYNTGSKYDLHTQPHNTPLLQNSVLHMGVRLYKRLPLMVKKLDNFNQFRKRSEIDIVG